MRQPEPRSSITGHSALPPQLRELARGHGGGEADHAIVGRVDLEEQPRLGADGLSVVLEVRAVGRADLAQHGARAPHDVRDAELAADLDQLSARDDRPPSRGRGSRGRAARRRRSCSPRATPRRRSVGGAGHPRGRSASRAPCGPRPSRDWSTPAATTSSRSRASGESSARPRFVWRTTPVALITRAREKAPRSGEAAATARGERLGAAARRRRAFEDAAPLGGEHLAHGLGQAAARDAGERALARERADQRVTEGVHARGASAAAPAPYPPGASSVSTRALHAGDDFVRLVPDGLGACGARVASGGAGAPPPPSAPPTAPRDHGARIPGRAGRSSTRAPAPGRAGHARWRAVARASRARAAWAAWLLLDVAANRIHEIRLPPGGRYALVVGI